jgi:hypothetical protein
MVTGYRQALLLAVAVTVAYGISLFGLTIVLCGHGWDFPEEPRAQGEALVTSSNGRNAAYRADVATRLIREPLNTWSNLAYCLAGAFIFLRARATSSRWLGIACFALAAGSWLYHASLMPAWRLVDVMAMYWVLLALNTQAFFVLSHTWDRTPSSLSALIDSSGFGAAVAIAAGYAAIHRNDILLAGIKLCDSTRFTVATIALAVVLLAGTVLGMRRRLAQTPSGIHWLLTITTGCAGIAITGQLGDRVGAFLSRPDAWLQGHTLWHIFGATALACAHEVGRLYLSKLHVCQSAEVD